MNAKRDQISAEIGARLRAARHAQNLSLAALSARTDPPIMQSRISNYEQGLRRMGLEAADSIARALGDISVAQLLGLDGVSPWTEQEVRLLDAFRATDERGRTAIIGVAKAEAEVETEGDTSQG